jgi:hypothetical protein
MPGDDGIRRDDLHGLPPACPDAGQHHPEQAVGVEKTQLLRRLAPEDDELVPQGEDLGGEFETAPKGTSTGGEDSDDECEHSDRQGYWPSGRSATKTRRFEFSVATRKRSGPYRWLRHPNYLPVALEFVFLPLLMRAFITLVVFSIVNLVLLRQRIRLEEMALAPDAAGRAMVGREA